MVLWIGSEWEVSRRQDFYRLLMIGVRSDFRPYEMWRPIFAGPKPCLAEHLGPGAKEESLASLGGLIELFAQLLLP